MRRRLPIVTGIICAIVALTLGGVLVYGLKGDSFLGLGGSARSTALMGKSETYRYPVKMKTLDSMEIDWVSGEVELVVVDGSEIMVTEVSNKALADDEKALVTESGGHLSIEWMVKNEKGWSINFNFFELGMEKRLKVEIPRTYLDKLQTLKCSTVSAEIKATGIQAKRLELDTTSGDVEFTALQTEDASVNTTSGLMRFVDCKMRMISMDTTSGNAKLERVESKSVEFSSVSGDLEMKGEVSDDVDTSTTSGRVSIESAVCPDEVDMESISGNQELKIPEGNGFTAEYSSISGDFTSEYKVSGLSGKSGTAVFGQGKADFSFESTSGDFIIHAYKSSNP